MCILMFCHRGIKFKTLAAWASGLEYDIDWNVCVFIFPQLVVKKGTSIFSLLVVIGTYSFSLLSHFARLSNSSRFCPSFVTDMPQNKTHYFLLSESSIHSKVSVLLYTKNIMIWDDLNKTPKKLWNITKAKTNCPFECPQLTTRNWHSLPHWFIFNTSRPSDSYMLWQFRLLYLITSSYDGLPPVRCQTIIWTKYIL